MVKHVDFAMVKSEQFTLNKSEDMEPTSHGGVWFKWISLFNLGSFFRLQPLYFSDMFKRPQLSHFQIFSHLKDISTIINLVIFVASEKVSTTDFRKTKGPLHLQSKTSLVGGFNPFEKY